MRYSPRDIRDRIRLRRTVRLIKHEFDADVGIEKLGDEAVAFPGIHEVVELYAEGIPLRLGARRRKHATERTGL